MKSFCRIFIFIVLGLISSNVLAGYFPGGWCTSGVVKIKGNIPWSGNAKDWYRNAKNAGYSVGSTPRSGAIVVYDGHYSNGYFGHVGIVTNNSTIIDMNGGWTNCGTSSNGRCSRTYNKFSETRKPTTAPVVGYIYYKTSLICPTGDFSTYNNAGLKSCSIQPSSQSQNQPSYCANKDSYKDGYNAYRRANIYANYYKSQYYKYRSLYNRYRRNSYKISMNNNKLKYDRERSKMRQYVSDYRNYYKAINNCR